MKGSFTNIGTERYEATHHSRGGTNSRHKDKISTLAGFNTMPSCGSCAPRHEHATAPMTLCVPPLTDAGLEKNSFYRPAGMRVRAAPFPFALHFRERPQLGRGWCVGEIDTRLVEPNERGVESTEESLTRLCSRVQDTRVVSDLQYWRAAWSFSRLFCAFLLLCMGASSAALAHSSDRRRIYRGMWSRDGTDAPHSPNAVALREGHKAGFLQSSRRLAGLLSLLRHPVTHADVAHAWRGPGSSPLH